MPGDRTLTDREVAEIDRAFASHCFVKGELPAMKRELERLQLATLQLDLDVKRLHVRRGDAAATRDLVRLATTELRVLRERIERTSDLVKGIR